MSAENNEIEVDEEQDLWTQLRPQFPNFLAVRLDAVKGLNGKLEAIDDEYTAELVALETEFNARRKEVYGERKALLSGETAVEGADEAEGKNIKGVPGFWSQCITNHPMLASLVTEKDKEALKAVTDITVEYSEKMDAFTLTFHFAENEFFTNATLSKTYSIEPNILDENPSLNDIESTPVEWKEKKSLVFEEQTKKQKAKSGKNKGQVRTITKKVACQSFFHYFSTPLGLDDEEEEEEEVDEEEQQFKFHAEDDMEIANAFRLSIIPDAFNWFTGEAAQEYDDEDYDEEEDEDEEDEDDEDDEDSDDSDEKPARRGGAKGGAVPMGAAKLGPDGKPAECKQN